MWLSENEFTARFYTSKLQLPFTSLSTLLPLPPQIASGAGEKLDLRFSWTD